MISTTILLLVPLALTVMLLSFFGIRSSGSGTFFNRVLVVILMSVGLSISFISFNVLLSQPKPAQFEWFYSQIEEVEIVSAVIVNEVAIYVWVMFPGENKPRYYELDWNKKQAEQLQKAMSEKRRGQRGKIMMRNPFGSNLDNSVAKDKDIIIFDPQWKQLPDKQYER